MKSLVFVLFLVVAVAKVQCSDKVEDLDEPCRDVKCTSGQECIIDADTGEGKCACIRECAENTDLRRRVCSNYNETWQSDCHLMKHRCDCLTDNSINKDCTENHRHQHIDYYGECKEIEPCQQDILEDFPRRMREWLNNVIKFSATMDNSPNVAPKDLAHKWIDAIIWKFCDLDKEPHDRYVSRHELFPLRAPLLSMESCISDFLDGCDANEDHKITLVEWGKCLGASPDEMDDKCNQFHSLNQAKNEPNYY